MGIRAWVHSSCFAMLLELRDSGIDKQYGKAVESDGSLDCRVDSGR